MEEPTSKPVVDETDPDAVPPIARNASWGAIFSIILILIMITVGAFYAWGKRLAEVRAIRAAESSTVTQ